MFRILRLGCLTTVVLLAVGLAALATLNAREASLRNRPLDEPKLAAEDKAGLAEARYLQRALGDQVWIGLGRADIPIILFNDRYEFLVGMSQPPTPWVVAEGDDFLGQPYHRRDADRPQAFAVPVGSERAGSISTLGRMNRDYLLGARRQLPPGLAQLFPYQWATLSRDLHIATILHEVFHAYQAALAPARFIRAEAVYTLEKRYPYGDAAFAASWNREGALLAAALRAADEAAAREKVGEFLKARDSRRDQANLAEDLIRFERELEWLEGLAKYAEIRFHELAASHPDDPRFALYRPGLPHWQTEFARLDGQLGRQEGDFRFYLSGMAQARLLDRLMPGWQSEVLRDDVYLEALLQAAAGIDSRLLHPDRERGGDDLSGTLHLDPDPIEPRLVERLREAEVRTELQRWRRHLIEVPASPEQLPVVYPEIRDPATGFGRNWYPALADSSSRSDARDESWAPATAGMTSIVSTMENTWRSASSAISSAGRSSGGGGGFSSGGGGGGGGGGGAD